jgi:CCDC81 eukaryotic HU domain 2
MVSRDFGANLKSGIYSQQDTLRPLELKGVSGVIPQVKANFIEISMLCNESKEFCRESCDLVIKYLSGRARKGEQFTVEIPLVGRFIVRQNVAAVSFADSLVQQTRGATAKTFTVGNIFGNSNATHNMSMGVTK